ncbi:hypothetical protein [Chitinophaga sp. sic0106]|uniref:hypothetical protein n=1 Tax=Chitinophaga sp. sic0106 TaxID=2854785 RepID=UPI001C43AC26|nr:hypothetical protein [Chitinophaga sp. sic0106]MBV7533103.1 hypothetical protein [Chitinophaga sp. sic0106]
MAGKHNRARYFQQLKRRRNADLLDFEEHMPAGFFNEIGKQAATNAINENKAMNLPITFLKEDWVVVQLPNGTLKQISQVQLPTSDELRQKNLVKGAVIHVSRKN